MKWSTCKCKIEIAIKTDPMCTCTYICTCVDGVKRMIVLEICIHFQNGIPQIEDTLIVIYMLSKTYIVRTNNNLMMMANISLYIQSKHMEYVYTFEKVCCFFNCSDNNHYRK